MASALKGVLTNDPAIGKYFPKVNGLESVHGSITSQKGLGWGSGAAILRRNQWHGLEVIGVPRFIFRDIGIIRIVGAQQRIDPQVTRSDNDDIVFRGVLLDVHGVFTQSVDLVTGIGAWVLDEVTWSKLVPFFNCHRINNSVTGL